MALRFFNTYSRKLEEFAPRDPDSHKIDIYTCGPTVYSRAHIGNFEPTFSKTYSSAISKRADSRFSA